MKYITFITVIMLAVSCKNKEKNVENKILKKPNSKSDLTYIYKSHKFPCGSGYSSTEINSCSQEKLQFVDSLLNQIVKSELNNLDNLIKVDKEVILKDKKNSDFFIKCLKTNLKQKQLFIDYQKYWELTRKLNSNIIETGCEGGTGCMSIINESEIKVVLNRIKEIQENPIGCN